jgi:hypothetical protein
VVDGLQQNEIELLGEWFAQPFAERRAFVVEEFDDLGGGTGFVDEKMLETASAQKIEKWRVTKNMPVIVAFEVVAEFLNRADRFGFVELSARHPGNRAVFKLDFLEQLVLEALERLGVEVVEIDVGRAVEQL